MSEIETKIQNMRKGGKALGKIKKELASFTKAGVSFQEIENKAQNLIKDAGFKPSFSTVKGYSWATCIMKNDELCHGIPEGKVVDDGDLMTIDVGLMSGGYHLDTTISFSVGKIPGDVEKFLSDGKNILKKAIKKAKLGQSVYDVSSVMESELNKKGYSAVYQLIGHGIGKELHMKPDIPCVTYNHLKRDKFSEGQTVAIEVMYTMGKPELIEDSDGWTYKTADGSLSAMFEETVLITKKGPEVLTKSS